MIGLHDINYIEEKKDCFIFTIKDKHQKFSKEEGRRLITECRDILKAQLPENRVLPGIDTDINGIFSFKKTEESIEKFKTIAEKANMNQEPQVKDWTKWVSDYENIGNDNEALAYIEKSINSLESSFSKKEDSGGDSMQQVSMELLNSFKSAVRKFLYESWGKLKVFALKCSHGSKINARYIFWVPASELFTKKGNISKTSQDLDNSLKGLQDALFMQLTTVNDAMNDAQITNLVAEKRISPNGEYGITVYLEEEKL